MSYFISRSGIVVAGPLSWDEVDDRITPNDVLIKGDIVSHQEESIKIRLDNAQSDQEKANILLEDPKTLDRFRYIVEKGIDPYSYDNNSWYSFFSPAQEMAYKKFLLTYKAEGEAPPEPRC